MADTWVGGGGDLNYATPTNWSLDVVPTGAAVASISATANVVHNTPAAFITTGNLIVGDGLGNTSRPSISMAAS